MPTRSRIVRDASGRPPTPAELERRRQILDATIAVIDRGGWAACTLQGVADEMGVTKAAVIYHVGTKAGLVEQAYLAVIDSFTAYVHQEVETATDPLDAVVRLAHAHVDYFRAHRAHARVIAESLDPGHAADLDDSPTTPTRAGPVAALITAAREDGHGAAPPAEDAVVVATVLNGMIDAAVAAWLHDPAFDLDAARRLLTLYVTRAV